MFEGLLQFLSLATFKVYQKNLSINTINSKR